MADDSTRETLVAVLGCDDQIDPRAISKLRCGSSTDALNDFTDYDLERCAAAVQLQFYRDPERSGRPTFEQRCLG